MGKYPNKIQCTCCKDWKGVRPDVLEARIEKAGSYEELIEKYICRSCAKAAGTDMLGRDRVPTAKKTHSYGQMRKDKMRRAMDAVSSVDPFDGILRPFWLHKDYLDRTEGRYWRKFEEEIIRREKGLPERVPWIDTTQITDVCLRPDWAQLHHDKCRDAGESCKMYDVCGLRMRGGLKAARSPSVECSECGQWVDESATICPKCSAVFDEEDYRYAGLVLRALRRQGEMPPARMDDCGECGKQIDPAAIQCPYCGAEFE